MCAILRLQIVPCYMYQNCIFFRYLFCHPIIIKKQGDHEERGKSPPGNDYQKSYVENDKNVDRDLKNANLATLMFRSGNPVHLALFQLSPLDCSSPKTWVYTPKLCS